MTYLRNYSREQLIALARERGIYAPENATDEELTVVERRLSAERGWIGEPQPAQQEWHTPGWLSEKGTGHSHFHPEAVLDAARRPRLARRT